MASGLFGLGAFIGLAYGSWNYPALSYYYSSGVDAPSAPRLYIEQGGEGYPARQAYWYHCDHGKSCHLYVSVRYYARIIPSWSQVAHRRHSDQHEDIWPKA